MDRLRSPPKRRKKECNPKPDEKRVCCPKKGYDDESKK